MQRRIGGVDGGWGSARSGIKLIFVLSEFREGLL